jgi:8-oxo-dGTP diphosphatase
MSDEIRKGILKKFMYNDKMRYNEVWDKKICSSSNFDYHFKKLVKDEFVVKKGEYYSLGPKGEQFIFAFDGQTLENKQKPVVCGFVLAVDDETGKVLVMHRKKQPFFDYYCFPGGKMDIGETTKEGSEREFQEETGLSCKAKLAHVIEKITYDKPSGDVVHHMIGYFYVTRDFEGKLVKNNREGDCLWVDLEEYKAHKRFPELDVLIPNLVENKGNVENFVIKRYKENDEIVDYEIIRE